MTSVEFMLANLFTKPTGTKINVSDIPQPQDLEIICRKTVLCVNRQGTLNVEYEHGALEFGIENSASLFTCMMYAYSEHWGQEGEHWPQVHSSWHKYIESYSPLFICYYL